MSDWDDFEEDADETTFAQGRLDSRTYASRSFDLKRTNSVDDGTPARFICKVFDPEAESEVVQSEEGTEWILRTTPAGRYQVKLLVAREPGNVKELWIQRVPGAGQAGSVRVLLNLKQPEVGRLLDLLKSLDSLPVEGAQTVRIDDDVLRDIFSDPDALQRVYRSDEDRIRGLIEQDETARDVIALEARRSAVAEFRRLLEDDAYFDHRADQAHGPESVWQGYFERNPWVFGHSLGSVLLTSWDERKLEQVVVGSSIAGAGKRSDALLQTTGRIRSMVLAEIKTHRTFLLASQEYRTGCWAPSSELVGAVAQVHGTVHRAVDHIGERIASVADDGAEIPGQFTYLVRPRSYLVVGSLQQLIGASGGDHVDKVRSFELYRRQLAEPEIITFDELLARAEWSVSLAEQANDSGEDSSLVAEPPSPEEQSEPYPWDGDEPF